VSIVSHGYGLGVVDLIETVQRMEETLKNFQFRGGSRMMATGVGEIPSDGGKLQLYFDMGDFLC